MLGVSRSRAPKQALTTCSVCWEPHQAHQCLQRSVGAGQSKLMQLCSENLKNTTISMKMLTLKSPPWNPTFFLWPIRLLAPLTFTEAPTSPIGIPECSGPLTVSYLNTRVAWCFLGMSLLLSSLPHITKSPDDALLVQKSFSLIGNRGKGAWEFCFSIISNLTPSDLSLFLLCM